MAFINDILGELRQEAAVTRRYLEKVQFDKSEFRPHDKSEKLGRLAIHVAEILAWWKNVLEDKELNFVDFEPVEIETTAELLIYFDALLAEAELALLDAKENVLQEDWSMKYDDEVLFTLNKKEVLRKFCMNHLIHHRAQLGIYLRILNTSIPATYGPSADDDDVLLAETYSRL